MKRTRTTYERYRVDSGHHRRILCAAMVLGLLAFVPVGLRLYDLMICRYDYYASLALGNQTRSTRFSVSRGSIYDRNMNILATSVGVENVYLDPRELKQSGADLDGLSAALGEILGKEPAWIRERAGDLTQRYKQIGVNVPRETAGEILRYINENHISGVHLEPGTRRVYPFATLAAQVVGFTNASDTGAEGVEAACDAYLSGGTGRVVTTKGNNEMDMPFSYESYIASRPGCDVILTIDTTVQACLEKRMEEAIDKYAVQNGAFGLVMNCKTGEILAMATLGSYDPNNYLEISDPDTASELERLKAEAEAGSDTYQQALTAARLKQWRNRVLSDGYEPGSTFKVLTMAAAIDSGAIDLTTPFYCGGAEQIPGRSQKLHCWRAAGHGAQTTAQALQNSCNIALAHIALKMGGETFWDYIERFGILEKTGIDLAGESRGVFFSRELITDTDKWGTASLTSASFGQTFKITPLQLVRAIASVVNGGELLEPYIVAEVVDDGGSTVYRAERTVTRRTISAETSAIMRELILSVVTDGTAKNARVAGFSIGGKTGTSEKIDVLDDSGRPTLDKIVSFVGIAPMEDPEYIVLVALDTPSRETGIYISGGVMAAPTVGAVMEDILPYLGVARSYDREDDPARPVVVGSYTGMTAAQALAEVKDLGIGAKTLGTGETVTGQVPSAGSAVPGDSEILLYLGEEVPEDTVPVPDFSGMNRQQAADTAGRLGLYVLVAGNTDVSSAVTVAAQSIPAGTQVPPGKTVTLTFVDMGAGE